MCAPLFLPVHNFSPRGDHGGREGEPGRSDPYSESLIAHAARLVDLGTRDFGEVWAMQRELCVARQKDEIPDTLLFVEHPHVITAGRSAHGENLLAEGGSAAASRAPAAPTEELE